MNFYFFSLFLYVYTNNDPELIQGNDEFTSDDDSSSNITIPSYKPEEEGDQFTIPESFEHKHGKNKFHRSFIKYHKDMALWPIFRHDRHHKVHRHHAYLNPILPHSHHSHYEYPLHLTHKKDTYGHHMYLHNPGLIHHGVPLRNYKPFWVHSYDIKPKGSTGDMSVGMGDEDSDTSNKNAKILFH